MADIIPERDALYYPYVHFPDEDWLKSALLFAPHVQRMVGRNHHPHRDERFMYLAQGAEVNGEPLLSHADLWGHTASEAQSTIFRRIKEDIAVTGAVFKKRFGKEAAQAELSRRHKEAVKNKWPTYRLDFQMHPGKLTEGIMDDLKELELAWTPDNADHQAYFELHPAIGSAFLGSLAVACAADKGLAIVGNAFDTSCQTVNQLAPLLDFDLVYDTFVHGKQFDKKPKAATGEAIADIILFNHCDVSGITVEDLIDLGKERQPIRDLKTKLQEFASRIPAMLDEKRLEKKLNEAAEEVLTDWRKSQPSFRGAMKKFFGADLGKTVADLAKGSIGKVADLPASATTAGLIASHFLGTIGGFGVGVVVHGITTGVTEFRRENDSPYRHLSAIEKAGVVFTVGAKNAEKTPSKA